MAKRRNIPLSDSDDSSSENSDLDSDVVSKKRRKHESDKLTQAKKQNTSDSDSDWAGGKNSNSGRKKKLTKRVSKSSTSESDDEEDWDKDDKINNKTQNDKNDVVEKEITTKTKAVDDDDEPEEGEVSDSSTDSSSDSEFDDGFDENLMGDDEDRARLNALSEKERETEIFKRIERRDMMKTRWEIERKLKLARRGDKAKDKSKKKDKKKKRDKQLKKEKQKAKLLSPEPQSPLPAVTLKQKSPSPAPVTAISVDVKEEEHHHSDSSPEKFSTESTSKQNEYFDPKERSKERKKNVEANRTDDKRSNAMALLKAKREGKAKREEEEAKRQAEREQEEEKEELEGVTSGKSADKIKVSDIYSDSGSSSSDEEEKPSTSDKRSQSSSRSSSSSSDEDGQKSSSNRKPVFISTKEQLNKMRLSRYKMERFINLPTFERIVLNSFVRINIGNNNNKPVYRVAEIIGVVETAKIYHLGKLRTNRGLRLKHGTQERVFRLEFISNQEFTDTEFDKWRDICEKQDVQMPTIEMLDNKLKQIKEALNYEFNDDDVNKIIEERNRFRQRPTNYAMKKSCLMKEREAALLRGDDEVAAKLGIEIEELETRANELDKKRSSSISLISYINDRNRKKNIIEAEKAIMEEKRANRGLKIEDPFTRRSTQPRMAFKANPVADIIEKTEEETEEMKRLYAQVPLPGGRKKTEEDRKPTGSDYNLYSLHDFEIDLDVPLSVNTVTLPKPVPKVAPIAPKRSLNLEDYKKKRGLI